MTNTVHAQFGNIDIYLFDQILKGRFHSGQRILDIGCGSGRNLVYFLNNGYDVCGIDQDPEAIDRVREMAIKIQSDFDPARFTVSAIESLPFQEEEFDLVIANAVLHFAVDASQFEAMLYAAWRVLKPGGVFFARLASNIGIADRIQHIGNGMFQLPDGTERYLVDQRMILNYTRDLNGELLEPIKTTIVQNLRSMTTWVMRKKNPEEEEG